MATAPIIPLFAYKRVPFDQTIAWMVADYSGAAPSMQIRSEPGDTGTPIISLGASVSGAQGVVVSYDADFPDPEGVVPNGASLIRIIIDETTLEALSLGSPTAEDVVLHYDLHLTPTGEKKFLASAGTFTISPGVTI